MMIILFIICLLVIRNFYTFYMCRKANRMVREYVSTLTYNRNIIPFNSCEEMEISYYLYLICIWKWKPIDMIKPQYREQLLYILQENKYIKKRIF